MNNNDDWLASDKIQHFVLCFLITIIISILASRTPYSLTRRHSISLASIVSLTVGAAKEVADELGFFESAGSSAKDALADILGVFLAVLCLYLWNLFCLRNRFDQTRAGGYELV
nr:60S ribosomal protein L7-1 [Tanacetum cinerariifolium]